MKIKKGDKVKIMTGKDKGKTGKVLQIFESRGRISVEGLNVAIKHMRPRKQGEKGQRIEFPAPLDSSNLMLVCPKCGKATRVGYRYIEVAKNRYTASPISAAGEVVKKKKKIRVCQKCKQTMD
jgi:large subunit ribosomal protein L24